MMTKKKNLRFSCFQYTSRGVSTTFTIIIIFHEGEFSPILKVFTEVSSHKSSAVVIQKPAGV